MKNIKTILVASVVCITLLLASCAKDGVQGPAGTPGANGTNGNANVKVFLLGPDSLSGTHTVARYLHVEAGTVDSGLVLVYYKPTNNIWYSSPGLGVGAAYQTRFYTQGYVDSVYFYLQMLSPAGGVSTIAEPLNQIKVIVAPGSSFGKTATVDYSDYSATMRYFGLKE